MKTEIKKIAVLMLTVSMMLMSFPMCVFAATATRLQSTLVVERGTGLWIHYDYYTLNDTANSTSMVYSRWDDGISYVALLATGSASINGTRVDQISVGGWW